jgi:hypothetical protein
VGALHVAVVTEFEHGMRAARRRADDFVELGAPAEFLAAVHRSPQRPLAGKPSAEGAGYPPADIV